MSSTIISKQPNPIANRHLTGWKKRLTLLLVLLVALGIAALICEVAVRLFCPPYIMPRWVENSPHGIRKQISNIRGFIVTPQYRHRFSSNSKGFRGTNEYLIPKPPGVFRVLALGDSVVCGYGVEDDQTFSARLEKKLSTKRPTEVLNLGLPGFGNAEELIQLEKVGLEYQPDLVILGYFVNDHFENLTCGLYRQENGKLVRNPEVIEPAFFLRDRLSRIPGYTFFCQHSYLVNFLRQKASGFFRSKAGQKHALGAGSYTSSKASEEQIALTSALVDEIIRVCNHRGIQLVVLNIPMEENGVWMQNLPKERLKETAPIVDVGSEIWGRENIWNIANPGNYHPKPLGHELIADWLANHIQKEVWGKQTTTVK